MKAALKQLFRRLNLAVVTAKHAGVPYLDHVPQTAFESVLLRCFPDLGGLNFIQVGANDGHRFDPINAFVGRYGWRGVLVEPVPANFRHLQRTYAGHPSLTLLQAAVDVQAGQRPIYHLRDKLPTEAPDWVWGLASFDREHLLKSISAYNWPPDVIETTLVPTVTWDSVWQRLPGGRCDLLVIDTEGYDVVLLRSAGLAQHRPRLVHFEHDHVAPAERLDFYAELIALGYELATDAGDTTAWLPPGKLNP
jgi:FkbM family methyltransferase